MIKKGIAVILLGLTLLTLGCETTKNIVGGAAIGIKKDSEDTWHALAKADDWIKKNLW